MPFSPATVHQNDSGDIITVNGSGTHFTLAPLTNASVVFCNGITTAAVQVISDTQLKATVNVGTFAPVGACSVTVTTGGEVATGGSFNILGGIPVITQISPNAAQQGQVLGSISVTGLYTNFMSGGLTVTIPGVTATFSPTSNTTATSTNFTVSGTAATGAQNVSVSDTTDGAIAPFVGAFTINAWERRRCVIRSAPIQRDRALPRPKL